MKNHAEDDARDESAPAEDAETAALDDLREAPARDDEDDRHTAVLDDLVAGAPETARAGAGDGRGGAVLSATSERPDASTREQEVVAGARGTATHAGENGRATEVIDDLLTAPGASEPAAVASGSAVPYGRTAGTSSEAGLANGAGDASAGGSPETGGTSPHPPAMSETERPRTRWAAIIWGAVFAVAAGAGLWTAVDSARLTALRSAVVEALLGWNAVGVTMAVLLVVGAVALLVGVTGLARRLQRRRAERA